MSVPVMKYQGGGGLAGLMKSPAGKIAMAAATGGASLLTQVGGPAGQVAGAVNTAKSISGSGASKDISPGVDPLREMDVASPDDYNPMQSKADSMADPVEHKEILRRGLAALGHPDVPQDLRDEYAEPMLTAYHFGGPREA